MTKNIDKIIKLLKKDCGKYTNPIVTEVSDLTKDPFKVLISCVLSLRTKDQTTAKAAKRLFEKADTPQKLLKLYLKEIEKLIYPVGFYKTKARNLKEICKDLIEIYPYLFITTNLNPYIFKIKWEMNPTQNIQIQWEI